MSIVVTIDYTKKLEYIDKICNDLQSCTGSNFQTKLGHILTSFYDFKHQKFEIPAPLGGDYKNDGWVKESHTFYQVYSPSTPKNNESLASQIQKKFKTDLKGLLEHLKNCKWGGIIEHYVFVVNTFDNNFPPDPNFFFDEIVKTLSQEYSVVFDYKLYNVTDLRRLLLEVTEEKFFLEMSAAMRITHVPNNADMTSLSLIKFMEVLNNKIIDASISLPNGSTDLKRISTDKKININNLDSVSEVINGILDGAALVSHDTFNYFANKPGMEDLVENVKNFVIDKYKELEKIHTNNVDLLEELCIETAKMYGDETRISSSKILVLTIFDYCDIFKKEKS